MSRHTIKCINPATKEVITTLPVTTPSEINTKIELVQKSQLEWQNLDVKERGRLITNVRKKIASRMDELIEILCHETGRPYFGGLLEVVVVLELMRFAAGKGPKILKNEKRSTGLLKTKRAYVQYVPYGVVGIISPWNFPLILTLGPIIQALIGGNGVILKPSENTPLTSLKLKEIFDDSGFPKDLLQVVIGESEAGKQIVNSPNTKLICFIGSVKVGKIIAKDCAAHLKPVILELGGKDPLIVLADADIDRASKAAVWGGMHNCGQICISVERVFVDEAVADLFIDKVVSLTKELTYGQDDEKSDIGCIINKAEADRILSQIKEVTDAGGTALTGGGDAFSLGGYYIPPTVIVDAPQDSTVMTEETFGPVITISTFKSAEEAVTKANSIGYGLNASIFTHNYRKAREMSKKILAGNICINDVLTNYFCVELPFGGMGISGIGRLHGKEGIRGFSQIQSICEDRYGFDRELWWYPAPHYIAKWTKIFLKKFYG